MCAMVLAYLPSTIIEEVSAPKAGRRIDARGRGVTNHAGRCDCKGDEHFAQEVGSGATGGWKIQGVVESLGRYPGRPKPMSEAVVEAWCFTPLPDLAKKECV